MLNSKTNILIVVLGLLTGCTVTKLSPEIVSSSSVESLIANPEADAKDVVDKIYIDLKNLGVSVPESQNLYDAFVDYMTLGTKNFSKTEDIIHVEEDTLKQVENVINQYMMKFSLNEHSFNTSEIVTAIAGLSDVFSSCKKINSGLLSFFVSSRAKNYDPIKYTDIIRDIIVDSMKRIRNGMAVQEMSNFPAASSEYTQQLERVLNSEASEFEKWNKQVERYIDVASDFEDKCASAVEEGSKALKLLSNQIVDHYSFFGEKLFTCYTIIYKNFCNIDSNLLTAPYDKIVSSLGLGLNRIESDKFMESFMSFEDMSHSQNKYQTYINNVFYLFYHVKPSVMEKEYIGDYTSQFVRYYTFPRFSSENALKVIDATGRFVLNWNIKTFIAKSLIDFISNTNFNSKLSFGAHFNQYLDTNRKVQDALSYNILKLVIATIYNNEPVTENWSSVNLIKFDADAKVIKDSVTPEFLAMLQSSLDSCEDCQIKDALQLISSNELKREWMSGLDHQKFVRSVDSSSPKYKITRPAYGTNVYSFNYNISNDLNKQTIDDGTDNTNFFNRQFNQHKHTEGKHFEPSSSEISINKIKSSVSNTKGKILHTIGIILPATEEFLELPNLVERVKAGQLPRGYDKVVVLEVIGGKSPCFDELIAKGVIKIE